MTPADRPPVPAEQEALDKPWRRWASVAIAAFALVSMLIGFVVLPASETPGFDPFAAICRSLGIPGFGPEETRVARPFTPAAPASDVIWSAEQRSLLAGADIQRGAETAASICAPCHGKEGYAVAPIYPSLAYQSAAAIFKQLRDYKSGVRGGGQAAVMTPFALSLDDQQMADVAAYYATRRPQIRPQRNRDVAPRIEHLVRIGDPIRALPPCDACHNTKDRGGPEGTPVILGQSAAYIEQQLRAFASGERRNDVYARMRAIARVLTDEEIELLAAYYGERPGD